MYSKKDYLVIGFLLLSDGISLGVCNTGGREKA